MCCLKGPMCLIEKKKDCVRISSSLRCKGAWMHVHMPVCLQAVCKVCMCVCVRQSALSPPCRDDFEGNGPWNESQYLTPPPYLQSLARCSVSVLFCCHVQPEAVRPQTLSHRVCVWKERTAAASLPPWEGQTGLVSCPHCIIFLGIVSRELVILVSWGSGFAVLAGDWYGCLTGRGQACRIMSIRVWLGL